MLYCRYKLIKELKEYIHLFQFRTVLKVNRSLTYCVSFCRDCQNGNCYEDGENKKFHGDLVSVQLDSMISETATDVMDEEISDGRFLYKQDACHCYVILSYRWHSDWYIVVRK